ncbi:hypothetical protein [Lactiplantibacillus plajomi]|uniref:Uncharacterized protein n=1 Tax=Lactiplantibacillus plajomi TaxID=1457217 RepID=A0ABV6K3J9_9LACO|nr:hypothetical protein [Lactiplantibacillus plajomi]
MLMNGATPIKRRGANLDHCMAGSRQLVPVDCQLQHWLIIRVEQAF